MTDDEVRSILLRLTTAIEAQTRGIAFLAASVVMAKVENATDAGAIAQLETLKDYFLTDMQGEEMKPRPRTDLTPGKKA